MCNYNPNIEAVCSESRQIEPNFDCNYKFLNELIRNRVLQRSEIIGPTMFETRIFFSFVCSFVCLFICSSLITNGIFYEMHLLNCICSRYNSEIQFWEDSSLASFDLIWREIDCNLIPSLIDLGTFCIYWRLNV